MAKTTPEELQAVTSRVIDAFTSSAMLFTALDVSNSVKQTLTDIRHREVAPVVREAFERGAMGKYKQTLIDVIAEGRKPAQAFLYHLPANKPAEYDDSMRNQLAIPPVPPGADAEEDDAITPSTTDVLVKVGLDGRGRLPRQLVNNAGIVGEKVLVRVQAVPPKLEIVEAGTASNGQTQEVSFEHPDLLHLPDNLVEIFAKGVQLLAHTELKSKLITIKDIN
ncbi:MAG TPA: hypothetical protein VGO62_01180 [Myxococcota bacterium]